MSRAISRGIRTQWRWRGGCGERWRVAERAEIGVVHELGVDPDQLLDDPCVRLQVLCQRLIVNLQLTRL